MSKHNEGSVFENNPFIEGLFEYMDSPRGQLSDEVREVIWPLLENVDVDAVNRKLIWENDQRLSIEESVQRIHRDYPEFPVEMIETRLISWLEMEFTPETYSQEQIDELDQLTEKWIDDYYGHRPHM
jgi:hypothetical protein